MNFYRLNPRILGGEKIIRSGKKDLIGTAGALSAVGMNSNRGPMKFSKIFTAQASGHFGRRRIYIARKSSIVGSCRNKGISPELPTQRSILTAISSKAEVNSHRTPPSSEWQS